MKDIKKDIEEKIADSLMNVVSQYNTMPEGYIVGEKPHTKHLWLLKELSTLIEQEKEISYLEGVKDGVEADENLKENK